MEKNVVQISINLSDDAKRIIETMAELIESVKKDIAAVKAAAERKLSNGTTVRLLISIDDDALGRITVDELDAAVNQALEDLRNKTEGWQVFN